MSDVFSTIVTYPSNLIVDDFPVTIMTFEVKMEVIIEFPVKFQFKLMYICNLTFELHFTTRPRSRHCGALGKTIIAPPHARTVGATLLNLILSKFQKRAKGSENRF